MTTLLITHACCFSSPISQFHWNNLIDLQGLLDGVIDRLPSAEGDYQTQHLYAHKNQMKTRNCDLTVYCNTKYLTFALEAALTYSLAVNRRKRAESKGRQQRSKSKAAYVNFQTAKIKADMEPMPNPSTNASNINNHTQHDNHL